ncbi:MAG: hypothetical protein UX99_C0003G0044 [Candidatus Amesbacteria bacterium GW2011_GWB1_47_26]|uniref:HicB-like antitoxin of toxin-antitoxin system domain-containing protein n=1 Tax=Candidatus Amesbacteria bacterium GW2011_GWC2_45_19 TaxID=1618366 RepID=A0A0G1Q3F0_9BACT|nr:MAG: hypothetical protein UX05_C0003G0044 [Candidatus Amesbacteria bacterium GW2011_GWC2_45_19]KKU38664.1 MAG: hypothetical protein UX52_C0002G0044 [Candidatus Amesbacteria bacterium GW2011_GWA1_46_35]KKU68631.1 MAG: hypothetical protein UX93_C0006G0048 [Microgenomates group bacterium GW2011_GWC1_47_20]KKU74984.1 MAG: hypothetical protein UX99_C0003G0044 [Candidatus Amesbacteria bacterium GW2011_GWB1_47_26]
MQTNVLKYNVIIRKEGRYFVAYAPTLGISDFGATVDFAKRHVHKAIACHIEGLIKTSSEVPRPDTGEFYLSQTEVTVSRAPKFAY